MQFLDKALKSVLVAGFAAAFAFAIGITGHATTAFAQGSGENFNIDETCNDNGFCSESADPLEPLIGIDRMVFSYEATLFQNIDGAFDGVGDNFIEKGVISFTGYIDDDGFPVGPSQLNDDYQMYAIFTATGTAALTGVNEITVTFDSFTIDIYISDDFDFGFLLAEDPGGTNGDATDDDIIIQNNTDDTLVATATMLGSGDAEVDGFGISEGDFAVFVTDFGLEMFGGDFFIDPDPFYKIANLDGNNSRFGTIACPTSLNEGEANDANLPTDTFTASFTTCIDGAGNMFFTAIPEPSTLGLFGIGLIAFGFVMTRRQRRSVAFTG